MLFVSSYFFFSPLNRLIYKLILVKPSGCKNRHTYTLIDRDLMVSWLEFKRPFPSFFTFSLRGGHV